RDVLGKKTAEDAGLSAAPFDDFDSPAGRGLQPVGCSAPIVRFRLRYQGGAVVGRQCLSGRQYYSPGPAFARGGRGLQRFELAFGSYGDEPAAGLSVLCAFSGPAHAVSGFDSSF